ncbi:hypothetical protein, partial [Klebsiella pneumoniae]|uniref:hypothetical protein n=1 Tax=Klebsiella pneumoniae TaxID=573 RepID=UPI0030138ADC
MSTFAHEGPLAPVPSLETSVKQETLLGHNLASGLPSLVPRKNEPSMMFGWRVGLASLLFNQ